MTPDPPPPAAVDEAGTALRRAEALLDLDRWDEAAAAASRVLAAHPDDPAALCVLARAHLCAERLPEAYRAAVRAVAVQPTGVQGHLLVSLAASGGGDHRTALAAADEAVRLDPEVAISHLTRARALLGLRWLREAAEAARQGVRLAPQDPGSHNTLGAALQGAGDRKGARAAYEQALRVDPSYALTHSNLASLDLEQRRLGRGARRAATALRLDPQDRLLQANLDVVGDRLLTRLFNAMLLTAFVLLIALVAGPSGGSGQLLRAGLGVALIGLYAALVWSTLRHLPPGMRRRLRGLPLRTERRWRWVLLAVLSVGMLIVAFAPGEAALVGVTIVLVVVRIVQVLLVFALVRWAFRSVGRLLHRARFPGG